MCWVLARTCRGSKRSYNKHASKDSYEPSAPDYDDDKTESPGTYEPHELKSPAGPHKHRKHGKHSKSHSTKHGEQPDKDTKHTDSKEVAYDDDSSSTDAPGTDTYSEDKSAAPSPKYPKKGSSGKGTHKAPAPAPHSYKELEDALYGSPSPPDSNGYEGDQQEEYEAPAPSPKKHSSNKQHKDTKHKGSSKNAYKHKRKQHKGTVGHDVHNGDEYNDDDGWYSLVPPSTPEPTPPPAPGSYSAPPPTTGYPPKPKSKSVKDDKHSADNKGAGPDGDDDAEDDYGYYDDVGKYAKAASKAALPVKAAGDAAVSKAAAGDATARKST